MNIKTKALEPNAIDEVIDNKNNLPNSLLEEIKTDKSDKTDSVISNAEFMLAVFGEVVGTERPMVVSFVGNPATVSKMAWSGKHWIADKVLMCQTAWKNGQGIRENSVENCPP